MFLLQDRERPWLGVTAVWLSEVRGQPRTDVCPQNPVFPFLSFQPSGRVLNGITAYIIEPCGVLRSKVEFDPALKMGRDEIF